MGVAPRGVAGPSHMGTPVRTVAGGGCWLPVPRGRVVHHMRLPRAFLHDPKLVASTFWLLWV
jgi:hypothetical protein